MKTNPKVHCDQCSMDITDRHGRYVVHKVIGNRTTMPSMIPPADMDFCGMQCLCEWAMSRTPAAPPTIRQIPPEESGGRS